MSNISIHVENLGKLYSIERRARYKTLQESILKSVSAPIDRLRNAFNPDTDNSKYFWALKGISFDVENGEVLGIIGRNGCGKSTLLKVLSRITVPTEGRAILRGRVGSLLEVGTGFHPELTGRENIYLSGSILGMKKREIDDKFDEIVKFSEVEKFLDTPMKRYSSGMQVRLGFAVAAHLDPEILLVDEVLAVGDVAFQKKCLGKMRNVAKEGRTVLFVSHDMGAVSQLCSGAILLNKGRLADQGAVQDIVSVYLNENNGSKTTSWTCENNINHRNGILTPLRLSLHDSKGDIISPIVSRNKDIYVEFEFILHQTSTRLGVGISLLNQAGILLFRTLHTDGNEKDWPRLREGRNVLRMKLPMDILNEEDYTIALDCTLHNVKWLFNPFENDISVKFGVRGGLSDSPHWLKKRAGIIAPKLQWFRMET